MAERRVLSSDEFEHIWSKIRGAAGEHFCTVTGKEFTYDVVGRGVSLNNTTRVLARSQFEKAAARAPISGPGQLQDLQGPSYLFAILTDRRIEPGLARANS